MKWGKTQGEGDVIVLGGNLHCPGRGRRGNNSETSREQYAGRVGPPSRLFRARTKSHSGYSDRTIALRLISRRIAVATTSQSNAVHVGLGCHESIQSGVSALSRKIASESRSPKSTSTNDEPKNVSRPKNAACAVVPSPTLQRAT